MTAPSQLDSGLQAAVPETGDAFGQMLLAAQQRAGMPTHVFEVTERDDGHISARDAYHYFTPVSGGCWEHHLLSTVTGRTLDIGCGAGRHLQFLAARGIAALGIDISLGAVQVCAERGAEAVHGDIRQPLTIGTFDTFLALGGNLGLLGSPETARELLARLATMANPGARIIAEGIDVTATSDPVHLAYQDANTEHGRHPGQIRMRIRHRNLATPWTDLWFPAPSELAEITDGTGWDLEKIHQDAGEPRFYAVLTWTGPTQTRCATGTSAKTATASSGPAVQDSSRPAAHSGVAPMAAQARTRPDPTMMINDLTAGEQ